MLRRLRPHLEWLWLAALLLVLSLHFWFPEIGSGRAGDSYSTTAEGKKAFYRLVEWELGFAIRNLDPFPSQVNYLAYGDTLCILGPARHPTPAEWDVLIDWVEAGGALVFAVSQADSELTIERLGLSVVPLEDEMRIGQKDKADTGRLQTELPAGSRLAWVSQGEISVEATAGNVETLVESDGKVQAVAMNRGSGRVVLVASDYVFTNSSLLQGDNAVLAFRLLEAAFPPQPEYVYFDESLNVSGTPKVVGVILDPLFRPLTIQLLAVLLAFGWCRSRRFGPLLPASVSARHNIVDHTDTVGMLLYRTRGGAAAVKSYLKQFAGELHLASADGPSRRATIQRLAARAGHPPQEVQRLFDEADAVCRAPHVSRRDAANVIRRLARFRQSLGL